MICYKETFIRGIMFWFFWDAQKLPVFFSICAHLKYHLFRKSFSIIVNHCKRISCHIVHLAHQLLHLRTSESMKLSLESLAFHILHLHIQFEDFSFLMVDLGLCFLHIRKWLCICIDTAATFSLSRKWTDSILKPNFFMMTKNIAPL